jgi:hypothetical protein
MPPQFFLALALALFILQIRGRSVDLLALALALAILQIRGMSVDLLALALALAILQIRGRSVDLLALLLLPKLNHVLASDSRRTLACIRSRGTQIWR